MITDDGVVENYGTLADVENASGGTEDSFDHGFVNFFGGVAGNVVNFGGGASFGQIATLENVDGAGFISHGDILGTVTNDGGMDATGTIGGDVINTGGFYVGIFDYTRDAVGSPEFAALDPDFGLAELDALTTLDLQGNDFLNTDGGYLEVFEGYTLTLGTLTNQNGSEVWNDGTIEVAADTVINGVGSVFINNGTVIGPVENSGDFYNNGTVDGDMTNDGYLEATNDSVFTGGAFDNQAAGFFNVFGTVAVDGPASNAGVVNMAGDTPTDVLNFGSTLAAGGTFTLDADLVARTSDVINVAGATSGAPVFSFETTGNALGSNILFFNSNGGTFTVAPSQIEGLANTGAIVSSVQQAGPGADLYLVSQVNPAIGGVASNIALTQSLITTVVNRPTSPLVDLGRVEGDACRSGGFARLSGGEATVTGESNNGEGAQEASIDSSFGAIQAGWDYGCYDGRYNGWDLAFGGLVGLTSGSTSQDVFEANVANPSLLTSTLAGIIDTDFDQTSVGLYVAARRDRLLADVQLRYDDTDFDFSESTVGNATPIGLNGATASSQALTLAARVSYVYSLETPGLSFIPNAGFSYTSTDGDTVAFTNGSGHSLVLDDYTTMIGFAGGTLARTIAGESGKEATTTFLTANYYQDFGDDPTSTFYDGQGGSQSIATSNIGGYGEIGVGLNYFADVSGRMGGVQRLNAAIRADVRSGDNVSDAYALTAQIRLSF